MSPYILAEGPNPDPEKEKEKFQKAVKAVETHIQNSTQSLKKDGTLQDSTQKEIVKAFDKLKQRKSLGEMQQLDKRLNICINAFNQIKYIKENKFISDAAADKLRETCSDIINSTSYLIEDFTSPIDAVSHNIATVYEYALDVAEINAKLKDIHPSLKLAADKFKEEIFNDPSKASEIIDKVIELEEQSRALYGEEYMDENL